MAIEPTKYVNGRMWQPGQSGNPNGRPVGSRTAFSQGFPKDLVEVWSEEGRETMVKTTRVVRYDYFTVIVMTSDMMSGWNGRCDQSPNTN